MLDAQRKTIQSVNQTIRDFANDPRIPHDEAWEFFCECGCFMLVSLRLEEFDACEGVWVDGHEHPEEAPTEV